MSPRPRETSDAEILAAAARVMQRLGPSQLTLAHVAKEAGVVPATLIQRFGTKRELLLAAFKGGTQDLSTQFATARAKYGSPLKTLSELFAECGSFAPTPEAMANSLAYLQVDLTDPEFHVELLKMYLTMRAETKKLLDSAVAARELKACDTGELARLIQEINSGAMIDWAVYRQGSLAGWMRRSLEALLAPYRTARSRKSRRSLPRR
jgi:AcrR family transcriptional regulator